GATTSPSAYDPVTLPPDRKPTKPPTLVPADAVTITTPDTPAWELVIVPEPALAPANPPMFDAFGPPDTLPVAKELLSLPMLSPFSPPIDEPVPDTVTLVAEVLVIVPF